MMIEVEQEVFQSAEYQEYCQLDAEGICAGYEVAAASLLLLLFSLLLFSLLLLLPRRS